VNPGIGVEPSVPLRLGVRPEVTLVLLGKKER
jgi:predicted MPP superfamily phosphohydrolase